ncbi:MAG TPA: acyltransferase family protein, partial [Yinghuangia sp.]|nr:acyltransferase family protein [Yinghuangia sp.]
ASYWTLPIQLTAFTVLLVVLRYSRTRPPAPVLLWTALLGEAALWPIRVHTSWEPFRMFHDGLGWHRMHLVAVGVTVFLVARGRIGRAHGVLLATVGMVLHGVQTQDWDTALGVSVLTAAVWAAAVGPDWDTAIPAWLQPAVRGLAGISYGVYLMHQSIGYVVMGRLHGVGAGPWVQVPAMLATGLLLGWLLTTVVERPAYDALTRVRDRYLPAGDTPRPGGARKPPYVPGPGHGPGKPPEPTKPPREPEPPGPRSPAPDAPADSGGSRPPGGVAS